MIIDISRSGRVVAGTISLAALAAIVVQCNLNLERDGSPLVAFALLLRFFTLWANLAAGVLLGWVAARGRIHAGIPFALATALAIVAVVYWALLAADHHPIGWDRYTNQMHHTIVPLATIIWWAKFTRPVDAGWRSIPIVTIAPLAYTGFALTYGAISGFYPYFFLDVPKFGMAQVLVNLIGLAAAFMLFGALLLALRRLVSPRA
ncbi:Pr6Pr family membrane protein [Qipengyuania sp. RANM35]|uniref:Pr6Pr family membrane protein n=1 Tax=Qipengyuania sp. RANM35 TaxID=3068635 RepID=UPI0034DB212D